MTLPHRSRTTSPLRVRRIRQELGGRLPSSPPALSSSGEEASFFQLSADLLCVLTASSPEENSGLTFLQCNPSWERLVGATAAQRLPGTALRDLTFPDDWLTISSALDAATTNEAVRFTTRFRAEETAPWRWLEWNVSPPDADGLRYAVARDVTAGKETEAQIRWQANHDPLTGLPNRHLLHDRMAQAIASASRRNHALAVLFIDLDHFKPINDTLGHAVGDTLLQEIARRMRACLRDEDTVARLGGDEFVVLLPTLSGSGNTDALQVANKLLDHIGRPLRVITGQEVRVTASVGVSLFPEDGQTPAQLLECADQAMYSAKDHGRGQASLHYPHGSSPAAPKVNTNGLERLVLQARLQGAVDRQEIYLYYQPQVNLVNGEVFGVEALMRWQQPEWGAVSPDKFIPVAEESGLIIPLGGWAVQEACRQAAEWHRTGSPLRVSVNLAAAQLSDDRFSQRLRRHLDETGLAAESIDMELTEGTFIHHDDTVLRTLHELKEMGIRLAVDDFGTGYSSLAYLRRFPLDGVKVDRSFITNLMHSQADEAVVRAVIDLSHTLGLKVTAEGVETIEQYECLRSLGCDAMQGYYFSAAVPPRDIPGVIAAGNSLPLGGPTLPFGERRKSNGNGKRPQR